jgi:hypothetical protein
VRIEHRRAVSEPTTRSGGREPAVGSQTASATAMRRISVSRFAFREHTTGGLRPPLLCCGANVCRRKTIFSMHKRTPKKSGGREPAVGVETSLHRHERDCPQDRRWCVCVCVDDRCIRVNRHHGGLTPSALVYRRPLAGARGHHPRLVSFPTGGLRPPLFYCGANVCRRKTIFSMHKRTPKKSGGREPAVGLETRLRRHERDCSADRRRCVCVCG